MKQLFSLISLNTSTDFLMPDHVVHTDIIFNSFTFENIYSLKAIFLLSIISYAYLQSLIFAALSSVSRKPFSRHLHLHQLIPPVWMHLFPQSHPFLSLILLVISEGQVDTWWIQYTLRASVLVNHQSVSHFN